MTLEDKKYWAEVLGYEVIAIPETLFPEKEYTEWFSKTDGTKGLVCRVENFDPTSDPYYWDILSFVIKQNSQFDVEAKIREMVERKTWNELGTALWYNDNRDKVLKAIYEVIK